jgi:hypothetical protein
MRVDERALRESPHVVGFGVARGSTIWGAIGVILGVFLTERTQRGDPDGPAPV